MAVISQLIRRGSILNAPNRLRGHQATGLAYFLSAPADLPLNCAPRQTLDTPP